MARAPRIQAPQPTTDEAGLLLFLSPGMVHQLGNALLAIQGNASQLGAERTDLQRARDGILRGGSQMQTVLEVLRYLLPADMQMPLPAMQAGVLLKRIGDLLRVPLRERGITFQLVHSSTETPVEVDGRLLTRAVLETTQALVEAVPGGFEGTCELDLHGQGPRGVELHLSVIGQPSRLPFPVAVGRVVENLAADLRRQGVAIRLLGGTAGVAVTIPIARPREFGAAGG